MSANPAVEIATKTDPGRDPDKQVNEDAAAVAETRLGQLAIVCDGMGGHAGGKEASELAVKTILEVMQGAPEVASPREALKVAIEEANRRVFGMPTAEHGFRPGSTVVCVLCHAGGAEIAHVGDSRIYLVHAGTIAQITKDHSMVQELVDRNLIRAEDAANHPDANKIMRALGIASDVEVDLRPEPVPFVAGDVFVLCSDGLSDLVGAAEILDIAGGRPPQQAAGQLVDLANARGGHDNITATIVRMKTTAAAIGGAATIVKTVPLTQVAPIENEGSGPRGTLLAEPVPPQPSSKTQMQGPDGVGGTALAPLIMNASRSGPQVVPPELRQTERVPPATRTTPVLLVVGILGLLLVLAAVAVFVLSKQPHVSVPVVAPSPIQEPVASAVEVDAAAPPVVIHATPPLTSSAAPPPPVRRRPDAPVAPSAAVPVPLLTASPTLPPPAKTEPPVCAQARALGPSSATYSKLLALCRAQGGSP